MKPDDGPRRILGMLSAVLVWAGAGIAAVLTIATVAVDRARTPVPPFDPGFAAGVVAILALAGALAIVMRVRGLDDLRRSFAACIVATLLIFVTRPEGVIGGSIALVGAAVGVLLGL